MPEQIAVTEQINELTASMGEFALKTLLPAVLILAVGLESRTAGPSQRALAQAFSHPGEGSPGFFSHGHEPVARREAMRCSLGSTKGVGWEFPPIPRPRVGCSCLDPWASWAKGAMVSEDPSGDQDSFPADFCLLRPRSPRKHHQPADTSSPLSPS